MKNLQKTLIAIAVLSAMPDGYRRAGFALNKGKNDLDATQEQYDILAADSNLSVSLVAAVTEKPVVNIQAKDVATESEHLKQLNSLSSAASHGRDPSGEGELTGRKIPVGLGLDLSTAPEGLAPFITVIDLMSQVEKLEKRPSCNDLACTIKGEGGEDINVKPSAAEADEAWAWYQENVVVTDVNTGDNKPSETEA